ncbi:ribulokinase [Virgibacillus indicus]|uniref:Ribulokinase n=1 Tax=Virgibacillus indicus TaxID=2024554 RepID=A0A265N9A0_9BACI|nr:ribulokinase [Virgibacillus indicus]OZU88044.1 ribulokinase [Virgibacillus indicus]
MKESYAIGVDYGTESGRAVLVSLENGKEIADHVVPYPHGVIDDSLPGTNVRLEPDWALQHPNDYVDVLEKAIPEIIQKSGINPDQIIGIGVDFTSCTMLPVDKDGIPLCYQTEFKDNPHSWVKLWKHHAAQNKATKLNEIAEKRGEEFLQRYGGKISSEWMIAKIWQIYDEANDIFVKTDRFVEAGDWVVSQLTNNLVKNSCAAGYKSIWHKQDGYPSKEFFKELDPGLENLAETKLRGEVFPLGTKAGELTEEMASITGLNAGTAVAVGVIDAHASVPAMGVVEPGKMVMAMGTSICHMLLGKEEVFVDGISGVVEDGIIKGFYGYEAGQPAGGDIFAWYVDQAVPEYVKDAADKAGVSIHQWLEKKASNLKPGESGLLALDWWNGNRTTLVDADLSGLLLGMTLQTKPEEIYRALLEAAAFGTRKVVDTFHHSGVEVNELYACGGLPNKNKLLMQIYADVTNRVIKIADSNHTPAIGAAMFGAVAAGEANGGFDHIMDAADKMARVKENVIKPIPENAAVYEKLYKEFDKLYDYFGKENKVMKNLQAIKSTQL